MTLNGIDIASYQSEMDVTKVPADFVFIKVTEGTGYTNPTWQKQAEQVLSSGKLLGFYHFASGGNPIAEADTFVNKIQPYLGRAILVLDFEADAINAWQVNGAKEFLDRVKSTTGVSPLIYMSATVTRQFDWSSVSTNYGLWMAQYATTDSTGYQSDPWTDGKDFGSWGKNVAIHQYTDNLHIDNWSSGLDGDLAYMDKAGWEKYEAVNGTPNPDPTPNPIPTPKANPNVNVTYGLRQIGGGWLGDITNFNNSDSTGFAGNPNHEHDMLYAKVDHGALKYRVHTVKSGWLGWITTGNKNDLVNGCAGSPGEAIDGVQCYYTTPSGEVYKQAYYRSQTTKRSGWLPAVEDDKDFAGMLGEPLDRLQIKIDDHNPY